MGEVVDIPEKVERALRNLLEEMPYGKITVLALCEKADISRKTFYSHFDNKEDVFAYIFKRDVIEPMSDLRGLISAKKRSSNPEIFTEKIYEAVLEDRDFYYKIVGPLRGVDDTFLRVASHALYDYLVKVIDDPTYKSSSGWRAEYTAYFFSTSQAMIMQRWISDGMTIPPSELAEWYRHITLGFWQGELRDESGSRNRA